jgi:hypothetical protein
MFKELEQLPGNRLLQASPDLAAALALGRAPGGVGTGGRIIIITERSTTTVCSARLSWRSPERFSRCRSPAQTTPGSGWPGQAANAASDRSRPA